MPVSSQAARLRPSRGELSWRHTGTACRMFVSTWRSRPSPRASGPEDDGAIGSDLALAPRLRLRCRDQFLQVGDAFFLGEEGHDIRHAQCVALAHGEKLFARHGHALGSSGLLAQRLRRLLLFDLPFKPGQFFLELAKIVFPGVHGASLAWGPTCPFSHVRHARARSRIKPLSPPWSWCDGMPTCDAQRHMPLKSGLRSC